MKIVTCVAPVNIALIKYWGKRQEELILPLNDSLSVTLNVDQMCAQTTVAISPRFSNDEMWLNGIKQDINSNKRLQNCLREIRRCIISTNDDWSKWKVKINSKNNFPTAAGLASSAAGYACLVYSLAKLFSIEGDISSIARQGSGSACRSLFGGFVQWHSGLKENGMDSIATQVAPSNHWPELRILILVVNAKEKKIGSTFGMQRSVETSELLKYRVAKCVPERMTKITKAIKEKDFETLGKISMQDSNQFHAVCLDTYPPAQYMTTTSFNIVDLVHKYNEMRGSIKVAYTFDAGPNACLLMMQDTVREFLSLICHHFPPDCNDSNFVRGIPLQISESSKDLISRDPRSVKYIIHTSLGGGPREIEDHLIDNNGELLFK